ncbi:strG [Symbiodinium necroappetens]|uniref:StrG protein n=1 Tax=Symbiodinium necroappetens TaxID=1628268 RepID=A0A812Q319_9DINO|nr:strG [Symbiodinium necroappetens]
MAVAPASALPVERLSCSDHAMPDSPSPTADTDHPGATPDWLELRAARSYPNWKEEEGRPEDEIDHRPAGGPRLSYLWCEDSLTGQTLYLGGNVGVDGKLYFIPGHAKRVMVCDPTTDRVTLTGPIFPGKFKWLRGVNVDGGKIYGLPCHVDTVLCIDVPSGKITTIPIPYDDVFSDPVQAKEERQCKWKYHGGTICPIDKAIYCIPQSALHVLKIDPVTGTCQLVGPELPGKYKWYGGVVGKHDQAIYGIPHNSPHVLRISPSAITLHGDYGSGGHKWHGASPAPNGDIVSVPANADSVLVIRPGLEPEMFEIGDTLCVKSGRHRTDRKYKFLGAMTGSDGLVYCFPSGSERVLQIDTQTLHVREVGPNLFDMERICQNKWQNGLTLFENVYAIPLAGESLLRIDCSQDPPLVTTWLLPSPHRVLDKWEGGIIAPNGVIYTVPNNHKAILRIEAPTSEVSKGTGYPAVSRTSGELDVPYLSGIPTLRSSAHRVKHAPRSRKHDPSPTHGDEKQPGTVFLPGSLLKEEVFAYDISVYNMHEAVVKLLQQCDADIVGSFRCESDLKLEDFCVPTDSTWRSVNGGKCEDAQKYLSDQIAQNAAFLADFDRLVLEVVLPYMKKRLVAAGVADSHVPVKFYYQRPPTLRLQPGPARSHVKAHNDATYGHQNGELNFWVPLTDRKLTQVDLHCESVVDEGDYHAIAAKPGEIIAFHGSSCRHYINANTTPYTRVSMDFRVGVEGYFDPTWAMVGTSDDHTRSQVSL